MDLRCPAKKFGVLITPSIDEGVIEISCPSRFCGRHFDVVVLHRFSTATGKLLDTRFYRDPNRKVK